MKIAPITLFTFKRLDTLKQTVEALQKNYLASVSDLIIYSDGAKKKSDEDSVNNVRAYLKTVLGFKSIIIHASPINKGLAASIIEGVTEVLNHHETVIVLEDDLVSSPNFLNYMNEALQFYKNEQRIFSIAGFSIPIKTNKLDYVYFTRRSSSWGWATWKNRWEEIDWDVKDYHSFKSDHKRRGAFNKMGSDMAQMLDRQMNGNINSWAIRWCYYQFKHNLYSVHPIVSKIDNIGFGSEDASNTKEKFNRYKTLLDDGKTTQFIFEPNIKLDKHYIKQYVKPFTITSRIKYKFIHLFNR